MSVPAGLTQFLNDLAFYPDRQDRIQFLIELAEEFQAKVKDQPDNLPEENRVPGCESEVFAVVTLNENQRLDLKFYVLNPQGISAMAMALILQNALNEEPPTAAEHINEELVFDVFGRELSMGKSGGLTNMIRLVKVRAKQLANG